RVQGAQAAVNNALNYGVQKRANERNNSLQVDMANRRLNFLLLNQAQKWRDMGLTEDQIRQRIQEYREIAGGKTPEFRRGGRIGSDSVRMKIANNRDMARANSDLRKLFSQYTKIVS